MLSTVMPKTQLFSQQEQQVFMDKIMNLFWKG